MAIVSSVKISEERVAVGFRRTTGTFTCRLRFMRMIPGDDPIEEVLPEDYFPATWTVESSNR